MKQTTKKVLDAAMELPEKEKIQIVEELLAGLEGETDPEAEAAWIAEIERRTKEIERGEAKSIPWSTVRKLAAERIREKP
ncbi:MAG: addiction module protein [Nitrospirae bacterium]|nr:addiction module protein [Nitrospirota bacterium]